MPASAGAASALLERRNSRVIWLLLAAAFVVILNETIMSVALPELMIDLKVDARAVQWLSTAFMLTMAVVIPITGFLIQRFSTRALFLGAMTFFSVGTLAAALAPGFLVLLAARVVQACGTAIMMPLMMTTIMTLVPSSRRGRVMGNASIVISVAPAIGPTISGLILHSLAWRWMFWIVLPIAAIMLLVGMRWVENVTEPRRVPIDVVSVVLSAFGFAGLVYGLSNIGAGTGDGAAAAAAAATPMWISLAVGAVGIAAFIVRQLFLQRRDRALLDLRTFTSGGFSVSIGMMVVAMMGLFGTIILLPIYLQQVLELDTLQIGLLLLPGGLVMGLLAPLVGRLYDRVPTQALLVPGAIVVSGALWSLAFVTENTPVAMLLAAHITLSLGLAFIFTPLFTAALGSVRPHLYSHASAVVGTVQQVAGAAGTALFVTIMSAQSATLALGGEGTDAAVAGGVRAAFLVGASISLLTILAAFFVRKPAEQPEGVPVGH
ncbi:DHA2 family efflux MFS transporter permease subunit [Microbacterium sp. STN6]|nr:DHA2 family efflux MFS transporter permease subunit [Microbacterium sp. STN6]MCX7521895.1 DHA2 family efflux MFS transporter permease subunit [Microbacterium sp. STN6]